MMNLTVKYAVLASAMSVVSTASAIELTDYVDPNSDYDSAYVGGSLNATNGGASDETTYNAAFDGSYDRVFSTLPQTWNLGTSLVGSVKKDGTTNNEQVEDVQFGVSGNVDNYFSESDPNLFWTAGGTANYATKSNASESQNYSANVGLGYGRVFNATPLARILRVEEELKKYGLLSGGLSDDLYLELAKIVAREPEYQSKYAEASVAGGTGTAYRAYMVSDIEKVLKRQSLLVGDSLGAVGSLKLSEVLFDENISTRRHGWVVRGGAAYKSTSLDDITNSEPALSLQAEYAKPYGYRGQFINTASYLPGQDTQTFNNEMRYTYEVSDTVDWENSWTLDHTKSDATAKTSNTLSSNYIIKASSALNYQVGLTVNKVDGDLSASETDKATTALNMAVRYRLK